MGHTSEPSLRVLHQLRLKGFVESDVIVHSAGLDEKRVEKNLADFEANGWARRREGRVSGWMLTNAGRAEGERRLARELEVAECAAVVADGYERFLAINQTLLSLCTDWQMREVSGEQVVNDHTDEAYDAAVVDRLVGLDAEVQPIAADLSEALARFESYGPRFTHALVRVQAGETDWFTKPMIDSYHTVWFELHENLLATLNIERAKQRED